MEILGIIPARGGSKSIPRKNIKPLLGKPLIAWSIESAKQSKLSRVIVSTDDAEIAAVAKKYGAEVPFMRPGEFALDTTPSEPVLRHALDWLKKHENYVPDAVALLQPTNPIRTAKQIDNAIEIFIEKQPDSVVTVHEAIANNNPGWILKRNEKDEVVLWNGDPLRKIPARRQELPKGYSRNDCIYLFKPQNLYEETPNLYGSKVELLVMQENESADINTSSDWDLLENRMKLLGY
ncbi:MAG: hypothetical protein A2849_01295 [Candidatus Taylorbacteria bacterium RIFCSPHIGHO2_01_FULL_51_15]|uniref:Acylneuraminate cytidylyltransferase n=1 Tax=Candidatus Taylorbacteria bacterium RIFCSPHIGHO2_01_FULL_51_15 TaxID=1802304 RepID=A0A1G2M911_9BACT|nr:MAG: hypothetical protein A2849_01295 [Candidatus Taylorbacteria bacterium RIFCSPHIGHO2_01_FULL_51_15]